MNPLLDHLHPYPFEKLRALFSDISETPSHAAIRLSIGEPQHASPQVVRDALVANLAGLSVYPSTQGTPALREAIAAWLMRRYNLPSIDPVQQVLPVNGSREALFAIAQCVVDGSQPGALVACPNPFYQIYEGAALLAGAQPLFLNTDATHDFAFDLEGVDEATWSRVQLLYLCSPGNPTGKVLSLTDWKRLFALSERYGFVIASDECYSEIYFDEATPPLGGLEAAHTLGLTDFRRLVVFSSLSKRSNVPGLRSGFVAGDAALLKRFLLYRTYHGCAMSPTVQAASVAAWNDEQHVLENRRLYRQKFDAVLPILGPAMGASRPDAGFYLWAPTPVADTVFAHALQARCNVTVLPGSYLARDTASGNPGAGRVRIALVAELDACVEAAQRMAKLCASLSTDPV